MFYIGNNTNTVCATQIVFCAWDILNKHFSLLFFHCFSISDNLQGDSKNDALKFDQNKKSEEAS